MVLLQQCFRHRTPSVLDPKDAFSDTQMLSMASDLPSAADFVDRLGRLALGLASAAAAPDSSATVTRVPSGAEDEAPAGSMGVGARASHIPLSRKVAIVRLTDRIARLHSPVTLCGKMLLLLLAWARVWYLFELSLRMPGEWKLCCLPVNVVDRPRAPALKLPKGADLS